MKKELRDRWCAALRGGEYQQCQGALRRSNSFCCLGVLANIVEPGFWDGEEHDGVDGELSDRHLHTYGLDEEEQSMAISWNDKKGCGFPEIADLIEKHIPIDERGLL